MTRGLAEITRLGAALGAVGQGFSSLTGKLKSIFKRG
jgi:glycerol-3-phosphate dehydrogenase